MFTGYYGHPNENPITTRDIVLWEQCDVTQREELNHLIIFEFQNCIHFTQTSENQLILQSWVITGARDFIWICANTQTNQIKLRANAYIMIHKKTHLITFCRAYNYNGPSSIFLHEHAFIILKYLLIIILSPLRATKSYAK